MGLPHAHIDSRLEFELRDKDFETISTMVKSVAGLNLPQSKRALVYSRLARRIRKLGLPSFSAYIDRLQTETDDTEMGFLINALTTNVTAFFRESHHFDHLSEVVLPELVQRARSGHKVRLWSAACSSGEEPYSIALCLTQAMPDVARFDVKILATDIDEAIVLRASKAQFQTEVLNQIPPGMHQHFVRDAASDTIRPKAEISRLITFGQLNLFAAWPFAGQFDAIFCRNVAIYFDKDMQERLWSKLAARLMPSGQLYIGHSERISGPARQELASNGITQYAKTGPPNAGA